MTGSQTPAGVAVQLPSGPDGNSATYIPVRNAKRPNATVFLDALYRAGYPKNGVPTEPALRGYWHTGIDVNGPGACSDDQGDPLFAVRDGVVEYVGPGGGSWGNIVILRVVVRGKTYWARYGHVQWTGKQGAKSALKAGQVVRARDVLAFIGRGAWPCAHLHFDVFHTKPPSWGWWPRRDGPQSEVTAYCTDPAEWLRVLGAVNP